jgi:ATP-dependent helicase HepA
MGIRCAFVQVDDRPDGIGKLVEFGNGWAEVEYFKSPAGPSLERVRVPARSVHPVELSSQTRIFWFDNSRHDWLAGRVDGGLVSARAIQATEDHYHVRFPNGQDTRIPISQLYTRWAHSIDDPTDYLAARITDTPFWFDARSRIVRHISAERAAFGGLTGLASAAVELLEHQVTIVRRILADPIERYLLADEVGLGKTIEAGILIRQHAIDYPHDANVLVIVPGHLLPQWKDELQNKFFLGRSRIEIATEAALLTGTLTSSHRTMLVVDEAHRTAQRAFSCDPQDRHAYEELRSLSRSTPRLLLLSGTPVLHQEDGFLAMLHLLDPDAYPLDDREAFRRRVSERQSVAEATADLMDDASSFFAEDAINRIEKTFAADPRLIKLCSAARAHLYEDTDAPGRIASLRALRSHLTEVYRLHRRLLRTRRGDPRVQILLPVRTGLTTIEHEDQSRVEAFDFLDAWRLSLPPNEVQDLANQELFAAFVGAALSHPLVLLRKIDARLASCGHRPRELNGDSDSNGPTGCGAHEPTMSVVLARTAEGYVFSEPAARRITGPVSDQNLATSLNRLREHGWTPSVTGDESGVSQRSARPQQWAFEGEKELLEQRRRLISNALPRDQRVVALSDWLQSDAQVHKAIIFVDHAEVADIVKSQLQESLPSQWVQRFRGNAEDVQAFEACDTLAVLVCDADAEEGLNLQRYGAAIIHYDLPLAPSRIEQRIGRVDRIEARGRLRNIAFSSGQPYEREWLTCLDQAVRIFNRSAAPLQYVLAEATARIRNRLVHDGWSAIEEATTWLNDPKTGLEVELRRIHAQEAIDAIDVNSDADAQFFEALLDQDESVTVGGERTLNSWVTDRLQFGRQHLGRSIFRYFHDLRRPTLLPMHETISRFQVCVDREALTDWRAGAPLEPMTFDRATAETKHVSLLRVGHPFMQSLEALIRSDDRGTAFAMWRHVPGWSDAAQPMFRFDFVIEADIHAFNSDLVTVSAPALRRRADEAFPVSYRTVWLTSDLEEVNDENLLTVLSQPYSKSARTDGGRDLNLRSGRWERAELLLSIGDWPELCTKARKSAEDKLRNGIEMRSKCESYVGRVRDSAANIANAFSSRITGLSGAVRRAEERMAKMEATLAEGLIVGIQNPVMRVDSAGVIVISGVPLELA